MLRVAVIGVRDTGNLHADCYQSSPHAQVAAVNGVVDYFESVAAHHARNDEKSVAAQAQLVRTLFHHAESALLPPLLDFLSAHPRVRLIGSAHAIDRAPTVAFTVKGLSSVEPQCMKTKTLARPGKPSERLLERQGGRYGNHSRRDQAPHSGGS